MKFIFVDGYNVINSWNNLKIEKDMSLDGARQKLIEILHNYGAIENCKIEIVFDGHKVAGNLESRYEHNKRLISVFTKDGETADGYIEKVVNGIGRKYEVYVVTSDSLEQQTIFQRGAVRVSTIEFYNLVSKAIEETRIMAKEQKNAINSKNTLEENIDDDTWNKLEAIRRS